VRYGWSASFLVAAGLCLVGGLSWLAVNPLNVLTQPAAENLGAVPVLEK